MRRVRHRFVAAVVIIRPDVVVEHPEGSALRVREGNVPILNQTNQSIRALVVIKSSCRSCRASEPAFAAFAAFAAFGGFSRMAAGWQDRVMCDGMDHWMRFAIFFFLNEFEIIGFFLQGEEGREGGRGRRRKGRDFSGLLDLIHSIFYYFFVLLAFRGISRVWRIVESLEFLAIPKILRDSQRFF